MKKLLFLTLALTMFVGCHNGEKPNADNSTLVSGIVMPTGELRVNDLVTITGQGFIKGDAISLRAAVKSSDINAVVTEVTESQLVFKLPAGVAAGKTNIVLKRDVRKQILGEVTIAEITPVKIYGLGWKRSPSADSYKLTELYEVDQVTGIATHVATLDNGLGLGNPLSIGQTMYAIRGPNNSSSDGSIISYNIDTKEFKIVCGKISNQRAYDAMGVIDGKLHVLAVVDDIVKLFSIDNVTSAKTEVANFGKLENPICVNGWTTCSGGFAYDNKNRKIIIDGFWDGGQSSPKSETYNQTVILDLSTKTISYLPKDRTYNNYCYLAIGSQFHRIYTDAHNGYVELLNDKSQVEAQLASIPSPRSSFGYDAINDVLYLYVASGLCSVDLKTQPATYNTVKVEMQQIEELFLVR